MSDDSAVTITFKDISPAIVDILTSGERLRALAERGYLAYGDLAGWLNYLGRPMPSWQDLPEKTRAYWMAAASAIVRKATSDAKSLPASTCACGHAQNFHDVAEAPREEPMCCVTGCVCGQGVLGVD